MIFADFCRPVRTSDLEKALNSTLSGLGYKILTVKENYISEEYINEKFVPVKEGIEYEVRKSFLGPKMYFGFKFDSGVIEGSRAPSYEKEYTKQLYGWTFSWNKDKYENTLLDVLKNTIKKVDDATKVNTGGLKYFITTIGYTWLYRNKTNR